MNDKELKKHLQQSLQQREEPEKQLNGVKREETIK